jgi:hypothetical protein
MPYRIQRTQTVKRLVLTGLVLIALAIIAWLLAPFFTPTAAQARTRAQATNDAIYYSTTRWGPFLLMRVMSPIGDPYERRYNPHVSLRPYLDGERRYVTVLRLGSWAFEIRHHRGGGE